MPEAQRQKWLVIDDDTGDQALIELMVRNHPITIDKAATGQQGIEKVHTQKYDKILCDLKLPGMSGIQTIIEIQKLTDSPVWIITGHLSDQAIAHEVGEYTFRCAGIISKSRMADNLKDLF